MARLTKRPLLCSGPAVRNCKRWGFFVRGFFHVRILEAAVNGLLPGLGRLWRASVELGGVNARSGQMPSVALVRELENSGQLARDGYTTAPTSFPVTRSRNPLGRLAMWGFSLQGFGAQRRGGQNLTGMCPMASLELSRHNGRTQKKVNRAAIAACHSDCASTLARPRSDPVFSPCR